MSHQAAALRLGIPVVELTPEQRRKWTETRSAVLWKCPAFTHILFTMMNPTHGELAALFTDSEEIPVAATDGTNLIINPKGFFSRPIQHRVFIVVHEIMHAILNHCILAEPWRLSGKVKYADGKALDYNPKIMNIAMDLIINDTLVSDKVGELPPDGWHHSQMPDGYNGPQITQAMSSVEAYRVIFNEAKKNGGGKGQGPGKPGSGKGGGFDVILKPGSGQGQDPGAAAQQRSSGEWKAAVAGALAIAKAQGKLPAGLERLLGEVMEPTVDWQDHIRSFLARKIGSGTFDWRKPDKRLIQRDIYHPRRSGHGCGEVVVGMDTSGSIGDREVAHFLGELNGILQDLKPSKVYVVWCDAMVHAVDEIDDNDDVRRLKPKGGGGTDFRPVFEWVEENDIHPEALVYLTDGLGSFPSEEPGYPVLWGDTHGSQYPFGDVVSVKLT